MKTIRNRIEDRFVTIPCLAHSGATHCSHKAAANCCRKGVHKFKPIVYGKHRMVSEAGRCGHVMAQAAGFSRRYQVECQDVPDSPFHERTTLANYKPHKWGAAGKAYEPRVWTMPPGLHGTLANALRAYCGNEAEARSIQERMNARAEAA